MEPWQSWAAAIVVGGGLFYYYTKDNTTDAKSARSLQNSDQPQASGAKRRPGKQTPKVKNALSNIAEQVDDSATTIAQTATRAADTVLKQSKKRKAGKEPNSSPAVVHSPAHSNAEVDDDEDTRDWAAQLEARKKGVSLNVPAASSRPARRQRPVAEDLNGSSPAQGVSMTSQAGSDTATQAEASKPSRATGDVSDMLEPRAAAPTVLRIVGEEKPKKQSAPRASPEPQETKKQRQNKRKVEEQRLERESQEKQRQILLEKQRRTAREARGEPARNGLAVASQPASNAWSAPNQAINGNSTTTSGAARSPTTTQTELLDTFEPDNNSTASSSEVLTNVTTPTTAASALDHSIPSEEAQLERLDEMNGWNEVPKGRKGKRKVPTPANEAATVESTRETKPLPEAKTFSKVALSSKPKQQPQANGFASLQDSLPLTAATKGHPDDSDWL